MSIFRQPIRISRKPDTLLLFDALIPAPGTSLKEKSLKLYYYRKIQLLSFLQVYSLQGFYELKRVRIFREGHPLRCEVTLSRKLRDWTGLKAKDKIFLGMAIHVEFFARSSTMSMMNVFLVKIKVLPIFTLNSVKNIKTVRWSCACTHTRAGSRVLWQGIPSFDSESTN